MTDLMRHHPGNLRFVVCCIKRSAIDVDETARQRECVDRGVIYNFELIRISFTRRMCDEPFTQRVDVCICLAVTEHWQFPLRLPRYFSSHFDVLLRREEIPSGLQS